MRRKQILFTLLIVIFMPKWGTCQSNDEKLGAWYMYFFNTTFKEGPWGVQGDIQYRNWNLGGDLEQLLIRSGITYKPQNAKIKFTLGYAHITSGAYGESNDTRQESRIYQEALVPNKIGNRFYLTHRFRFEQRFVEDQDFRTRLRYNIFLNVPLNNSEIVDNTFYLSFYNEIFINGQKDIGEGTSVELFDRDRLYGAVGYAIKKNARVQLGLMRQFSNAMNKNQLQVSLHHRF
ncbi:DUF2490 domain-containing protein [Aureibacter tunicatorum]|uniref:DUF2490 domain-containing protein n=1 Tax=Aureibacter tunicatorum TaxID=866807 RepID=A0AAE4BRR3_9BACT|nr:DUF2490 domain-containing protein [Aureibacter tunicatorum]MDR6238120.1 hypothetical protein [Aureibacter tunicatorum]BDD03153.1 hypothetical protein AUTU_06360 [Aureibacter tunicatorum]